MIKTECQILIVTTKLDPHADAVIDELSAMGHHPFRLNTEDLLTRNSLLLQHGVNDLALEVISDSTGRRIDLTCLQSAYYRKPKAVLPPPNLNDSGAAEFAVAEAEEFLRNLYHLPSIRWVNHPGRNRKAQPKFPQLKLAQKLGLKTPRSLITNDPQAAKEFCAACDNQVICKSLITTSVKEKDTFLHTYTHKLSEQEVRETLSNVKFAPTFFQEYISKKIELRVTVIGNEVFACEIDSQGCDESKIDWRRKNPLELPHRPYKLPSNLQSTLRKFMRSYGLNYSAFDIILTPKDEFVFLENNPNGQFYWIELMTKMPMANAMARLLIQKNQ